MNNYTVNLKIYDECCTKCGKNTVQQNLIINSPSQTVDLQDCYLLNVITVEEGFIKVIIQNGINVYIRTIFETYSVQINLATSCPNTKHVITISTETTTT